MNAPAFGLNRFDFSTPDAFATDVARAESLGWDYAFVPDSQLRRHDTYVLLAFAARETSTIHLGPLLANPVTRHPTVTAGSIATVDAVSEGRAILGLGIGDTAVRLAGLKPARVATLEDSTRTIRSLLHGDAVEVGADRPAQLPHPRSVPVWIAAAGPRSLRAAGRVADGVFIRAGLHPANLHAAVDQIRAGADEAGRDPASVRLGLVVHTALQDDPERALLMGKSIAAGFYEYSPHLFNLAGLTWDGPDIHELQARVHPDFHHHPDLVESGCIVDFLPDAAASAFSAHGTPTEVAAQLVEACSHGIDFDIIVPHPIPNPPPPGAQDGPSYMERVAHEVIPVVRDALGTQNN
ncbi:MAG: LLM class flavin-dependent oxidoreductase [Dehalococcoidia bacterium]|jgi:5,10-methylenetetrahydromethanopterin reductase|nr:LLM class flavin-dependent oxidoreductase [Dehalococcoidia bacterium]